MTPTVAPDETTKKRRQFQEPRKLRAWGATLKPNSILRHEPPATIAVLRAIVGIGGGEITFLQIAYRAGGISWRHVQRIVKWARATRLIHVTRIGGKGRGQIYRLMPTLAENFLGIKKRSKRSFDMTSKSQHRRSYASKKDGCAGRDSAPRCDAAPTPRPPPRIGAGETAGSAPSSQAGRERVPSDGAGNIAARSIAGTPAAPGRVQRSKPTPDQIARADAAQAQAREILARPPDKAARDGPARRRGRPIIHPEFIPKKTE